MGVGCVDGWMGDGGGGGGEGWGMGEFSLYVSEWVENVLRREDKLHFSFG
jgi:hypothetical protein